MALSRWCSLPLHLRRGVGPLVFATARLSGNSARAVPDGRFRSRVQDREMVRANLHAPVRPPGRHPRQLARSSKDTRANGGGTEIRRRRNDRRRLNKPQINADTQIKEELFPDLRVSAYICGLFYSVACRFAASINALTS